jgi:hypothetical protein
MRRKALRVRWNTGDFPLYGRLCFLWFSEGTPLFRSKVLLFLCSLGRSEGVCLRAHAFLKVATKFLFFHFPFFRYCFLLFVLLCLLFYGRRLRGESRH